MDVLLIHDRDVFSHGSQFQVDVYLNQLLTGGWRALSELRSSGVVGAIGARLNDAEVMLRLLETRTSSQTSPPCLPGKGLDRGVIQLGCPARAGHQIGCGGVLGLG